MTRRLEVRAETFAVRGAFVIARGSRTEARVLTVGVHDEHSGRTGRGECTPYARYGETEEGVAIQIRSVAAAIADGASRHDLLELLPAGAARNAVDAALWDLELQEFREQATPPPADLAGLPASPEPVRTVRTLSLGTPAAMAEEAARVRLHFATLKLKLGGEPGGIDLERVAAVRDAAPALRLIVDANESWPAAEAPRRVGELVSLGVAMVEQPLPAGGDEALADFEHLLPLCADESFHTVDDLDRVAGLYEIVNLKLDKTGGLTHALEARRQAEERGLQVMIGCMLGTSLAMAPALLLAQGVDLVDLDGPYLLAEDRDPPLGLGEDGWIAPAPECWG